MSGGIYAVAIPKWGIEMENGTVTNWHSDLGDTVTQGDELVDIESDKIVNTLEATASGVLRRVLLETDGTLSVGELIGVIADADVSEEAIEAFIADFNVGVNEADDDGQQDATPKVASEVASNVAPTQSPPAATTTGKVRVSPPVRRRAEQLGIDISSVVGSGPGGRITSDDVERAANGEADSAEPAVSESTEKYTATKLSSTQQTIGRRLVESKQSVPHFYLGIDIELDKLLAKREELNAEQSVRVSINDMIVWCTSRALMSVPEVNAQLVGDEVRQFEHADISVAVATDRGLLTPIIRGAEQLSAVEISSSVAQLIEKAKTGGLERNDIAGGSFTVSNLGMYGVDRFDAIINPPQVAILALGKAQKQFVVRKNDETAIATVITASLSCDHRVVDGALGGRFLSALKREIESQ